MGIESSEHETKEECYKEVIDALGDFEDNDRARWWKEKLENPQSPPLTVEHRARLRSGAVKVSKPEESEELRVKIVKALPASFLVVKDDQSAIVAYSNLKKKHNYGIGTLIDLREEIVNSRKWTLKKMEWRDYRE